MQPIEDDDPKRSTTGNVRHGRQCFFSDFFALNHRWWTSPLFLCLRRHGRTRIDIKIAPNALAKVNHVITF